MKTLLPACIALAFATSANAAPTFLELIGVIPGPVYDWEIQTKVSR